MADNVAITAGSGTTIAADEVSDATLGSVKVQYVKLMDGTLNGTDKALVDSSGLKVNLGVDNDVTITGSVAVTGTFYQATQPVSLASVPSHAVTNAGTFVVQENGAALTALQLIDNAISGAGFNITQFGGAAVPIGAGLEATAIRVTLPTNGTGVVGLAAGTNGIGKLTANSGVDIGDVDVTSIAAGDNNIGNVDIASALPAGTNAIGKLAANSGVDIGDVTLTAGTAAIGTLLPSDIDITTHTNYAKKYYTNAGAVTDGIIWSPAAGKRWHVLTLYINISSAATITLEDDLAGGDSAVWKGELAANSGVVLTFPERYPFASGEDAADLIITTTAGNVYVTAVGYEI